MKKYISFDYEGSLWSLSVSSCVEGNLLGIVNIRRDFWEKIQSLIHGKPSDRNCSTKPSPIVIPNNLKLHQILVRDKWKIKWPAKATVTFQDNSIYSSQYRFIVTDVDNSKI